MSTELIQFNKSLDALVHHTVLRPHSPNVPRSDHPPPPLPRHEARVEDGGDQQPRSGPRLGGEVGQARAGRHTGQSLGALGGQN